MPQFTRDEVNGLTRTFNMYVSFPENKWNEIRLAEKNTKEGNKIYSELRGEFIQTFWKDDISFGNPHDYQEEIYASTN